MSAAQANQRTVVATLRLPPPDGGDRWTVTLVAKHSRLSSGQANEAIRSLRNAGKIKFGTLELSASMMEEYRAKAGDEAGAVANSAETPVEPVSRGADARTSAATSELMDATAGETAPVSEAAGRGRPPQRESGRAARQAIAHKTDGTVGRPVKPPAIEPATEPFVHPGCEQGDVAAAGDSSPLLEVPGHTHPAVSALRPTADVAGAVPLNTAPAPSVNHALAAGASGLADTGCIGIQLLHDVEAYLTRTRMASGLFGGLALKHYGFVGALRARRTARPETARMIRAFMARWPDGTTRDQVHASDLELAEREAAEMAAASRAAAPGDVSAGWTTPDEVRRSNLIDEINAEAVAMGARRRQAKCTGTVKAPLSANVVGLQAALLADPEDAFVFLRRKWPELLRGVIGQARAAETTPATMLVRVIEAGLSAVQP